MSKIRFNINYEKALQVILWVAKNNNGINVYNLLKVVFAADCYHLNKYGRPVVGDTYIAMVHGTVPSVVYDIIKGDEVILDLIKCDGIPFKNDNHVINIKSQDSINEKYFSESDIEALNAGLNEYGSLSFKQVEEKNHTHKAWINAINRGVNSQVHYEDMIENKEILEDLKENCQYIAL
jgi:uncharacterized phage-associated protein